jgi:hypothetical protein
MNYHDYHNMVSAETAATAAFATLSKLQDLPPAVQVAGAAYLFILIARRLGISEREALLQAERRINDAMLLRTGDNPSDTTRAIQAYLNTEI